LYKEGRVLLAIPSQEVELAQQITSNWASWSYIPSLATIAHQKRSGTLS